MKKRKRFEYKMQRRTKEKDVYLQYIQYEIGVLQLIKLRREVLIHDSQPCYNTTPINTMF